MLRNSSGMALLITLAAISFLVAVTVQLATSVNWQIQVSANQMEDVRLNADLHSVLSLLRAALYSDAKGDKVDTVHDEWNLPDREKVRSLLGVDELTIDVRDLSGRMPINRLWVNPKNPPVVNGKKLTPAQVAQLQRDQKDLWRRFLLSGSFAVEQDEVDALIDALIDWLDDDNLEGNEGAEDGYYQSLPKPYTCRNGSLQYPEELLLVKGFSQHEGIINYLTIDDGDGKININTAPKPVLQALAPGIDEDTAQQFIDFRDDLDHKDDLKNLNWYQGIDNTITINPALITTQSSSFFCTIIVKRNGFQLTGTGRIFRDNTTYEQQLLSWQVD